jgi:drug/metabolite transporter (DMT)-like permease
MILKRYSIARATAMIVLSSFSFGSLSTLTLLITRAGLPLLPAMLWRYLLAAAVLLFLTNAARGAISRKQALRLMVIGGLGQAVVTYFSLRALDYMPVGPLAFLFYTYPAWVALIAGVTGREELTPVKLGALGLAMAGVVVMLGTPSTDVMNVTGASLALGTAVLYALYLPALHKAQEGIPPLVSTFYLVSGVFLSFLLATLVTGGMEVPQTPSLWALLLALSMIGTVLAFTSLISGLRTLGPVRTSIIAAIEPFFTALLGVLILRERFTLAMIAGGVMIALAVMMLQWNSRARISIEPAS